MEGNKMAGDWIEKRSKGNPEVNIEEDAQEDTENNTGKGISHRIKKIWMATG